MKRLFVELLYLRCITYALRIVGGAHAPHAPSKSATGQGRYISNIGPGQSSALRPLSIQTFTEIKL